MDSYETFEQLQLVLRTLQRARKQLGKIEGMQRYVDDLEDLAGNIELEVAELLSLEE